MLLTLPSRHINKFSYQFVIGSVLFIAKVGNLDDEILRELMEHLLKEWHLLIFKTIIDGNLPS